MVRKAGTIAVRLCKIPNPVILTTIERKDLPTDPYRRFFLPMVVRMTGGECVVGLRKA
jgi:hypothetical protein